MRADILTFRGEYFDFERPAESRIWADDIAHALSQTCRFGGHCWGFYSVAQHCVLASQIVPVEHAMAALMHDAAEAYVGDIPSPLKRLLPEFKAIERRVEAAVVAWAGLALPWPAEVKAADLVLLATEQRDLMAPHDDEWALIKDVQPLAQTIVPWSPGVAKAAWLDRYRELRHG